VSGGVVGVRMGIIMGIPSFLRGTMIRIWTRGQILPQKSKFSELPKNKWVCSPRRHEPNAIRFVSNGRRERKLSRSVRQAKQVKKGRVFGVLAESAFFGAGVRLFFGNCYF
jgi:hypothetical protein